MVKEIVHDPFVLAKRSEKAAESDLQTAQDLLDTIAAHKEECVGMAANMIGVHKRIIVFQDDGGKYTVMLNPEITKQSGAYETEEGCLSLQGAPRRTKRYQKIQVKYQTTQMQTRVRTYSGWTAQIIQHEIDHCNGVLI